MLSARALIDIARRLAPEATDGEVPIHRWLVLSLLLGVVAGLGAHVLQYGIDTMNRLALVGLAGFSPPGLPSEGGALQQVYLPSYAGWRLLLVLTVGGLITGLIVYTFAPEAEGHGTDAVIRAFHREGGYIRSRVPIVKIIASAVTLGSGGSGGREGPIAQIGSGFGSWLATRLRLSDHERRILTVAGAAGGIGAIFRAPLGGALVICELLYRNSEFEHEAIVPAVLTSVVAYSVYSLINGWAPMFETSEATFAHPESLVVYFILGIVLAALGWCYVKTFYGLRDHVFERLPVPRHLRPAIGGALTGLLGLLAPQAISLGYGWVQLGLLDRLTLRDYITGALGKIVATGFTISSGGSGGVFGPAVVIGGFAGGAVGTGFARLLPSWHLETQSFILVGMAAFFGGAAKAPIGAILMITEMTAGYGLLVPLMLTSAITFMLLPRRVSIYEEQVDGSVNSPAHLERYMRHLAATMKTSVGGESPGRDDTVRLLATTTATLPAAEPTAPGAVANASFVEARVTETGGVVGRCLGELALPAGALAVAVRRGVTTTIVSEGTRLEPGDLVVFLADEAGAEGVRRLFRAYSTPS